jgi:nucleoside-diphosphate-sugar epimerase
VASGVRVLVTGANGFVGSHIVDALRARSLPTAVLLRPNSDRRFLSHCISDLEVRQGSVTDPASLKLAVEGVSHVIHCAGLTKACANDDYFQVNQLGTRHVVEAVNQADSGIRRFIHISSLAAVGPATQALPATEEDTPHPVSVYGRSKLAGEREVQARCRVHFTVVRPPAVYGPRDQGFFSMFQSIHRHLLPRPNAGQALSIVYVRDLAEAAVSCLDAPGPPNRTYFVASQEIVTGLAMAREIARQIDSWTIPVPLPSLAFWPVCLFGELKARLTGRPSLLNLQKLTELRAPGWVCDPARIERELGLACRTKLSPGIAETLSWYRRERWL